MVNALGWDIEIAKEFPTSGDWREVAPLGISCAALAGESWEPVPYFSQYALSDAPILFESGRAMSVVECRAMVDQLATWVADGYRIITWNGLGFDFQVLAQEVADPVYARKVAELALDHIDLGFAMLCDKGYMIGLNKAAHGLRLSGKTKDMSGALAPVLWNGAERELTVEEQTAISVLGVIPGTVKARELCLAYVKQDAVTTFEVFDALMREQALYWVTRNNTMTKSPWTPFVYDSGDGPQVRPCREAYKTPVPDTSWMSFTMDRNDYIGWALELCP